jgi:tellurite resistance protein TerC
MTTELIFFIGFCIVILLILFMDLELIGKGSHVVSVKESFIWTSVWVSIALGFYLFLLFYAEKLHGITNSEQLLLIEKKYAPFLKIIPGNFIASVDIYRKNLATEFITGYFVEYSLSVDNVFVIMMILGSFAVKEIYLKEVLFWGILGAIILRGIFIFTGSALVQRFDWILLLFGAFLLYQGLKIFIRRNREDVTEPHNHWLFKYLSMHFPIQNQYSGSHFVIRQSKKLFFTPLLVVLIMVEFTDLIFAFDSIPAVFAVTRDPLIVFFSNIFAIIGLRSLFFLLRKVVHMFHYLKIGIAFLLMFIGIKLLLHTWLYNIGFKTIYSLYIIILILALSIGASLLFPINKDKPSIDL